MKTKTISGIFSLIAAVIITLIIFLSNHEFGVLSLLIPLFFIILGIYLLNKRSEEKIE